MTRLRALRRPAWALAVLLPACLAVDGVWRSSALATTPDPIPQPRGRLWATNDLASGKLLVAHERLADPNFARSVVLLIDYGDTGAMGLVVNQPTEVELSELLSDVEGEGTGSGKVYIGGPVMRNQLMMLIRAAEPPAGAERVVQDVHFSADADTMRALLDGSGDTDFRVYSGYSGWAPGQLEAEVGRGDWHILPAAGAEVFNRDPFALWRELTKRSSTRLASLSAAAQLPAS